MFNNFFKKSVFSGEIAKNCSRESMGEHQYCQMCRFYAKFGYFLMLMAVKKIVLGVVARFWLFLTRPLGGNGGICGIKTLTRSAIVE